MKILTLQEKLENIKSKPAGVMAWIYKSIEEGYNNEFVIYIREDRKFIKRQGYNPVFQFRNLIINTDIISAFSLMVKINNDPYLLYDCWINYSAPVIGVRACEALSKQKYLKFIFIDEFGQEFKTQVLENPLINDIRNYMELSKQRYPWVMEEFDFIKSYIYKKYPNGQILWENIASKNYENIDGNELKKAGKKGSVRVKELYYF